MPKPSWKLQIVIFLLAGAVATGSRVSASEPTSSGMYEIKLRGQKLEGTPLVWNDKEIRLLGRDGRLWKLDAKDVESFKKSSDRFSPDSTSALRAVLLREFGNDYEVSGTTHYLVVHPRGQRNKWAERFEDLYRSFVHFFSVRGFKPSEPQFPLVGVVCSNRTEFIRHFEEKNGIEDWAEIGRNSLIGDRASIFLKEEQFGVVGKYNLNSNRITLYDMGGDKDSTDWLKNANVLIHEATHQTAFNTGIHSRYSPPPLWVAEGLAMMFEAPGVYNSRSNTRFSDRVNRERLRVFQKWIVPQHKPEVLASMVASDHICETRAAGAYAEAWAFSFFLMETEPAKYEQYLKRTASHPPFQQYTSAQRTADFQAIFGTDWRMLEARFLRFMAEVK
jgi:hypothetical protein